MLNTGEKLTLSFSESGSSYYVRLKDFAAAAAHTLTLKTPDGATVVLKDRSGAEITGSNGAYTVAAGYLHLYRQQVRLRDQDGEHHR